MFQNPAFESPEHVISKNIQQLEELSELLVDEIKGGTIDNQLTPAAQRCKEALLGVRVLMPKLRSVLATKLPNDRQLAMPVCIGCEE